MTQMKAPIVSASIAEAKGRRAGARYWKVALQVNPYSYLKVYGHATEFADEAAYNAALVAACIANGVEVVAITDHHRVDTGQQLTRSLEAAGVHVFPGIEVKSAEGVHLLLIFEHGRSIESLLGILGALGVHEDRERLSTLDANAIIARSREWGAACVAAHVTTETGGLLATLHGQACATVWRNPELLACAIPGSVQSAGPSYRPILRNETPEYKRERPLAVLNAQDVKDPTALAKPGAACFIKMSSPTVEGLRQAFIDPESRVRLPGDLDTRDHARLIALAIDGGFLDGLRLAFSPNLNVAIGGRGAGKSTLIEAIRYVLGVVPLGKDAVVEHNSIVQGALAAGTKVSLLVRVANPAPKDYIIERTVGGQILARDYDTGRAVDATPARDLLPTLEIYGQHEIAELTKDPVVLTRLLERFVTRDRALDARLDEAAARCIANARELQDIEEQIAAAEARLLDLPGLRETLRRYENLKLEERLGERTAMSRERSLFTAADAAVANMSTAASALLAAATGDRADPPRLAHSAIATLPSSGLLGETREVVRSLGATLRSSGQAATKAAAAAEVALKELRSRWQKRVDEVEENYGQILRELKAERVDATEFVRLRDEVEGLEAASDELAGMQARRNELEATRSAALTELEDVRAARFRELDRAVQKVNKALQKLVRVSAQYASDRSPVEALIKRERGGRLKETFDALARIPDFSPRRLAAAMRKGSDAVAAEFGLTQSQAQHLTATDASVCREIEVLELPTTTQLELNIATDGTTNWRALGHLSKGQKATAVLLLLLLKSDGPLIVDQPEDDLDNRFITDDVVEILRTEKHARQFLVATHNANIPVLGDAELIFGLTPSGEAGSGVAEVRAEHVGSVDVASVRQLIEEVLEGGRRAFELRRLKYGG